jgi:ribosomal protein S9
MEAGANNATDRDAFPGRQTCRGSMSDTILCITGKEWHMKTYDIIVIGSGSGGQIVENALNHGLTTALVDKGPAGGTCLNVG